MKLTSGQQSEEWRILKRRTLEYHSSTCPWKWMLTSLLADKFIRLEMRNTFLMSKNYYHHVIVTSCIEKPSMVSSSDEAEVRSFYAETVLNVEEAELAVDEEVAETIHYLSPAMVPDLNVAERGRGECVTLALEQLSGERELALMLTVQQKEALRRMRRVLWLSWVLWNWKLEVKQKGSSLPTTCSEQVCRPKKFWRVSSLDPDGHYVRFHSPFSLTFNSMKNLVAINVYQKVICSARLDMGMTS